MALKSVLGIFLTRNYSFGYEGLRNQGIKNQEKLL